MWKALTVCGVGTRWPICAENSILILEILLKMQCDISFSFINIKNGENNLLLVPFLHNSNLWYTERWIFGVSLPHVRAYCWLPGSTVVISCWSVSVKSVKRNNCWGDAAVRAASKNNKCPWQKRICGRRAVWKQPQATYHSLNILCVQTSFLNFWWRSHKWTLPRGEVLGGVICRALRWPCSGQTNSRAQHLLRNSKLDMCFF